MLGIFKEKLVKAPKELNNPASLNSCTKPKPSHEILKDFMACNSSNAFSMCFGNDALLAYSPSNKPSIHHRLFSGLDNIYCVFLGGLHSLSMVNKQYGLSKGTNKAMFITEAYQTLRDRGPYPADQVLKELEGSLGFVIYDNKDGTIFVAFGSNGQIGLYWGVVAYSSIVIYENMELIKASCAKSLAPFPTVENGFSELSTAERQEIQMKKAKLIGMLDEKKIALEGKWKVRGSNMLTIIFSNSERSPHSTVAYESISM
ncbi:hypothetical protein JHK86_010621 [Glycine max]|nr:hypothetical protein JHK86_010621 [Glycine max]